MNEENRLRPFGPGRSTYDLWRWRNYVDFRLPDVFRLYVEMIDTSIFHEDLPATAIDLNRWDLLNAFVDLKVGERDNKPIYLRFGRQELLYGSQHLISPLNWGNTRRNFEGFKITSKGATWDIDAFVTRPVNTGTGNGPLSRFDHERDRGDASRTFNGVYATHHGLDDHTFDLYWLWLCEQEPIVGRADGSRHTVGLRWQTTRNVTNECCQVARIWTADIEGAYQFGHDNGETLRAGFLSAKLGHTWKSLLWEPTLTAVYYWGSGDRDPTDDENNTFSVLFPLGHAYWGLIDNLSGQNLNDYSLQATVKPAEKLKFATAVHWFDLDTDSDVLYNVAGAGLGLPGTGTEIGEGARRRRNLHVQSEFERANWLLVVLVWNFRPEQPASRHGQAILRADHPPLLERFSFSCGHENHKKAQKKVPDRCQFFCVFLRLFVAILFIEMWFRLRRAISPLKKRSFARFLDGGGGCQGQERSVFDYNTITVLS